MGPRSKGVIYCGMLPQAAYVSARREPRPEHGLNMFTAT